jgi:hypothetical protein
MLIFAEISHNGIEKGGEKLGKLRKNSLPLFDNQGNDDVC